MRCLLLIIFSTLTLVSHSQSVAENDQVKLADQQLNELILKNNAADAKSFYAEDFVLTTSSGKQKLKADILNEIGSPDLLLAINSTQQVNVRVLGSTAVLTGILHQKGTYKGKEFEVQLRVTDTWVKTSTGWKILAGHASTIPKT